MSKVIPTVKKDPVKRRAAVKPKKTRAIEVVEDLPESNMYENELEEGIIRVEDENRKLRTALKEAKRESTLFKSLASVVQEQPPFSSFSPFKPCAKTKIDKIKESALLVLSDCHGDQEILPRRVNDLEDYNFDVACLRAERIVDTTISHLCENMKNYDFETLYIAGLGDYVNGDIHNAQEHSKWKNALKNSMGVGEILAMMVIDFSKYFKKIVFCSVAGNHGRRQPKKDYRGAQNNWDYLVAVHAATRLKGLIDEGRLSIMIPDAWSMGIKIEGWNFVLNHGDDMKCFLPGSLVTVNGYGSKPIETIIKGDKVLCSDGLFREVDETFEYDHEDNIVNISAYGLPDSTWEVTSNHEVFVVKGQKVSPKNDSVDYSPEWMPAGHVSIGDYLAIPKPKQDYVINELKPADYTKELPEVPHPNEKLLPETIPVGKEIGYMLGQYLGDGCIFGKNDKVKGNNYHSTLEVIYHEDEKEFWEEYIACCEKLFNITPRLITRRDMTIRAQRVHIGAQRLAHLIAGLGGRGSFNKEIHEDVFKWNKEALRWLLIGYLRADGHTCRRKFHDKWATHRVTASTVSKKMGQQLYWIARICGYAPSLKYRKRSGKEEAILSFYGEDARDLGPVTQRFYEAEGDLEIQEPLRKVIDTEKYTLVRVTKCYREYYEGKKYDLAIKDLHDYTVNNAIVHNSWNGLPYYGVERKTRRITALGAVNGVIPNYYLYGHFHTSSSLQHTTGEVIMNGSWMSTDEYALEALGAYSEPFQWLMGVHKNYGITWRLPIKLRAHDWKTSEKRRSRYSITMFGEDS